MKNEEWSIYDSELVRFDWVIPDGYTAEIKDGNVIVEKKITK